jgi:hypothetical protein
MTSYYNTEHELEKAIIIRHENGNKHNEKLNVTLYECSEYYFSVVGVGFC